MRVLRIFGIALAVFILQCGVASAQKMGLGNGKWRLFPPAAGSWAPLKNQPPTGLSLPIQLTDGTIMVHSPESSDWYQLSPDSKGNYVNGGTWKKLASMPSGYAPLYYASSVLPDGRVVVIGGEYNGGGGGVWTNLGAIYEPRTNTWQSLAAPPGWNNVGDAQCVVLPDGRMVLAMPFDTRMAVLDAKTLSWTNLLSTGKGDRFDEEGWCLLPDGTVLTCDAENSPHAERYIPSQDKWISAGDTPQGLEDPGSEELGPMILRPNGTVFAMGATGHNAVYTPSGNLTDPGTWAAAPDFPVISGGQYDIADGPACLLPSGNVLCEASPGVFNSPAHFFEFDGTNLTQVPETPNSPGNTSFTGNFLVLPTGEAMFTDFSGDVEAYTSVGDPQDAWRPAITDYPAGVAPGFPYTLKGTQFNGMAQGSNYGDDSSNASNYPLVRITNLATGDVRYCRTHDHSTMAVQTGSAIVSTVFDVPADTELGQSTLEVVTNGIASHKVQIDVEPGIVSIVPDSNNVQGGTSVGCTITLGGTVQGPTVYVPIMSSRPSILTVPATVPVQTGQRTARFQIGANGVVQPEQVTVSASYLGATVSTVITDTGGPTLTALGIHPNVVPGGNSTVGILHISAPAQPGGATVLIFDTSLAISTPATVTIPAGQMGTTFTINTSPVGANATRQVIAQYGDVSMQADLTLTPGLKSFTLNPAIVVGGATSTGTVTLVNPAPAGGAVVVITSGSNSIQVPATVSIPAGQTSATFTVKTLAVAGSFTRIITAKYGPTIGASLTLLPGIQSFTFNPNPVVGGATSTGTIVLGAPAGAGGQQIKLSSQSLNISVPASVTVPAGQTTVTFNATTTVVFDTYVRTVQAQMGGASFSASLTLVPGLVSLTINPTTVHGGQNSTGTITLTGNAPAGGQVVALSATGQGITVPASVTVPAGQKTVDFTITTSTVTQTVTGQITATLAGKTSTQTLTVNP